jgi:hypothetical protein
MNTTTGLARRDGICTDFAFAAAKQTRNIGAMHKPQQNGQQQKQGRRVG